MAAAPYRASVPQQSGAKDVAPQSGDPVARAISAGESFAVALGEPPRALPRFFGQYKLFDYIGKGGMAEIYLARAETALGAARLCVVKQIISQFAEHPEFAEMLIHEAKLAARLSHANIVQVLDLGRESGQLYIAMEYVEGYDLNALLRRCSQTKTPLPMEFALRIVCDALAGLDYAHRAKREDGQPLGLVHRDVSPSNILISLEGEVKLCDFGIAHANEVALRDTASAEVGQEVDEAIKGKAGYMAPEHARGEAIDARADVFAAGIVLWELLSGRRLYKVDASRPSLLEQARRAEIPEIPVRGLPDEARLHAIAMRALARDRDARYASAAAMLRDLEHYVASAKLSASPLKLGEWVVDRFGVATIQQRRAREQTVSDRPPPPQSAPMPAANAAMDDVEPPPSSSELPGFPPSAVLRGAAPPQFGPPSEKVPSSVALGTIDLGPPSSAPLLPSFPLPSSPPLDLAPVRSPSKSLVLAVILVIVFGVPALVASLLAMR